MPCETFPSGVKIEKNPAIKLFGNRLFLDQTSTEFLVEFLLLVTSSKKLDSEGFNTALPSIDKLLSWGSEKLEYAPKSRINLKLFSFLGASRLDSRHVTHRQHHQDLLNGLKSRISMSGPGNEEDVIRTLENLLLGFQGAGGGRTWCAQSFLPVSAGFLAGETIWRESKARSGKPEKWDDLLESFSTYFSTGQHVFLARGGEVLYLQLCNAFRQPKESIQQWVIDSGVSFNENEQDPAKLHADLESALKDLLARCPATVTKIAEFIDSGIESETSETTDLTGDSPRFVFAGWCPAESWQEGYLFAVDLLRLCKANIDIIDRLYLLESACSLQVLRSLAMQSVRYVDSVYPTTWPGYRMAISAPEEKRPAIKRISHHSAKAMEKLVFQAVRSDSVQPQNSDSDPEKLYKEADRRYAGKLFVGLAKRIGFLVPRRGAGARFVLNKQLLRLLVVTTVPLGGRLTFDTFKHQVELRHGFVFDADGFNRASKWVDNTGVYLPVDTDSWLQSMLEAAGLLIHLSDSCALVVNPADSDN